MALKASLLLAFFLLISGSLANRQQQQQQQNQCQLDNIDALEPREVIQSEAGVTEFWDSDNQQFQCAGVEFVRHRIQPGGLLLPSYVNTPLLSFIERGKGVQGVILPGCPETFELSTQIQYTGLGFEDRHQKVQDLRQGDVVAVPAGAAHWIHNDGDTDLVVVVFFDTQNNANQLDQNLWRFFLAGNPQGQSQQQQQQPQQGRWASRRPMPKGRQQQSQSSPRNPNGNIFQGFDSEFLAEAFNVERETAEKLQGLNDQRGHIVNVEHLRIVRAAQRSREEQEQEQGAGGRGRQQGGRNGVEETICSTKLKENIDNPSHADFVNPLAGEVANLNSYKFPILRQLQLSAERGFLQPNAIQSPHWTLNAHNLIYVTQGSMRVQIVNNQGQSVFDNELRQGQVVVVPQNFAVVKRANEEGSRWIAFRTNDNAMISNLAGRVSTIRSLPVDVVANSYQLSKEDAQKLKNNQQQAVLFKPSGRSQGRFPA